MCRVGVLVSSKQGQNLLNGTGLSFGVLQTSPVVSMGFRVFELWGRVVESYKIDSMRLRAFGLRTFGLNLWLGVPALVLGILALQ